MDELKKKITQQQPLVIGESLRYLLDEHRNFLLELDRYQSHHEHIKDDMTADAVIVACSDARNEFFLFRDFVDNNIILINSAGNSCSGLGISGKIASNAIKNIKHGGLFLVVGHAACGAVAAAQHRKDYEKISPSVAALLDEIILEKKTEFGSNAEEANTIAQALRIALLPHAVEKSIHIFPIVFDFSTKNEDIFNFLSDGTEPQFVADLRASAISRMKTAKTQNIKPETQYSHAIVLSDPFSIGRFNNPRIIFNASLNELFTVSFFGDEISKEAIASIEYALLKVRGVSENAHIVILHPEKKTAEKIKNTLLKVSRIIKEKTKNGKAFSFLSYNPKTREVTE